MNHNNLYHHFNEQARQRLINREMFKTRRTVFTRLLAPMTLFCLINFAVFTTAGMTLRATNLFLKASNHSELNTKVENISQEILELAFVWLGISATGAYLRLVLGAYARMEE